MQRGIGVVGMATLLIVGACSDSNSTAPLVATAITVSAVTNGQTGVAGTVLAQPVGVLVVDQNGAPFANATVTWTVTAGGGSVASPTSVTDATGTATVAFTLGSTVGVDSLEASIAGGESAFITATATAGPATAMQIMSGGTQSVAAGSTTAPLVVKLADQFGNPVPNATVTWAVAGGGTLSATTSTTDATGTTQTTLTTDAAPANYSVTATTGSLTPVTFTIAAM